MKEFFEGECPCPKCGCEVSEPYLLEDVDNVECERCGTKLLVSRNMSYLVEVAK